MTKICFVVGVHGEETKPIEALNLTNFTFVVAHPEAIAKGKRFVEEDLNRCFPDSDSLEGSIAKNLVKKLAQYDLVIDVHTTTVLTPPFCIITQNNPFVKFVALENVVFMPPSIASGHSLIDHVPNGIALEFSSSSTIIEIVEVLNKTVQNVLALNKVAQKQYLVEEKITDDLGEFSSFDVIDGRALIMYGKRPHLQHLGYFGKLIEEKLQ